MSLNLQELIKFRVEIGRELTHEEVDNNFKKVANPWDNTREYYSQDMVILANGNQLDFWIYINNISTLIPADIGVSPDANVFNGNQGWIKIGTGGGGGGIQGIQGFAGLQGTYGMQGFYGMQGIQGFVGAQGQTGLQGYTGLQGTNGSQGIQGLQGPEGHGMQGWAGQIGERGIQGSTGVQGISGEATVYIESTDEYFHIYQGMQGPMGIQGLEGPCGIQGLQGIQGIQGYNGQQGVQGSKGEVIIYNPDEHEEFVVYQGTQGIQGTRGFNGFQGIMGLQGVPGSATLQGSQGVQGMIGVQGVQGIPGFGLQGMQGVPGPIGYQGIQGFDGLQGERGMIGDVGIQGIQGIIGERGIQGFQGIQGCIGLSTYNIFQQIYPSATIEDFFAALQGMQGPRGPEGTNGSCGCHTGCNECKIHDTITQFIEAGNTITISFADMLYEFWNDNVRSYVNDRIPTGMTVEKHGNDVVVEFTASSNSYINIYYEYFDISMGNYILITPRVFIPVE